MSSSVNSSAVASQPLHEVVAQLRAVLEQLESVPESSSLRPFDFQAQRREYLSRLRDRYLERVLDSAQRSMDDRVQGALEAFRKSSRRDPQAVHALLDAVAAQVVEEALRQPPSGALDFSLPRRIPDDIAREVGEDVRELERCYENDCLRSCVILCGRVLEAVLHRVYFDRTQFDILEKNPGIGLGTLIAKMEEKGIKLDPGITQQVHLINQVRIFSVHKKKEPFTPSREQTQAIILYTLDIVRKLYA